MFIQLKMNPLLLGSMLIRYLNTWQCQVQSMIMLVIIIHKDSDVLSSLSIRVLQLICEYPILFNIPLSQAVQVHQAHPSGLGSPSVHADLELLVHPWSQVQTASTQVLQLDPWVLLALAHLAVLLVQHPLAVLHDITTVTMTTRIVKLFHIILLETMDSKHCQVGINVFCHVDLVIYI